MGKSERLGHLRGGSAPWVLGWRDQVEVTVADVPGQVLPHISAVGAVRAGEWPLPRVSDQVTLEVVAPLGTSKYLATGRAVEGGTEVCLAERLPPPRRRATFTDPIVVHTRNSCCGGSGSCCSRRQEEGGVGACPRPASLPV